MTMASEPATTAPAPAPTTSAALPLTSVQRIILRDLLNQSWRASINRLAEAMTLHTLSDYHYVWGEPPAPDSLIRLVIGESIPPRFLERLGRHLMAFKPRKKAVRNAHVTLSDEM